MSTSFAAGRHELFTEATGAAVSAIVDDGRHADEVIVEAPGLLLARTKRRLRLQRPGFDRVIPRFEE